MAGTLEGPYVDFYDDFDANLYPNFVPPFGDEEPFGQHVPPPHILYPQQHVDVATYLSNESDSNTPCLSDASSAELPFPTRFDAIAQTFSPPGPTTDPQPTVEPSNIAQTGPKNSRKRAASPADEQTSLTPPKRTRRLEQPEQTAQTRVTGACICCQISRQRCEPGADPEGPCKRCQAFWSKKANETIVLQPCWRVKISDIEVFRRGPTVAFAWSLRWASSKADGPEKGSWKPFKKAITTNPTRREDTALTLSLTQNWTVNALPLEVDRYNPQPNDRQHYEWFDNGVAKSYHMPPYSILDPDTAIHAIEQFLNESMKEYIAGHMVNATAITKRQFEMAQSNRDKPLVHQCLQLWVACRFIEKPWHLTGEETLGLVPDPEVTSPYHHAVPVTPIIDFQLDNLVIHNILQPLLAKILKLLDTRRHRVKSDGQRDWNEVQLAYFILMHNIELTIAHDVAFARRYNLQTQFSNIPLINMLVHGANTLLTYFHHAHQGYGPFSQKWEDVERSTGLTASQKEYLMEFRNLLRQQRPEYVHNPAKELFWTSQLFTPSWRPVVLVM